MSSGDTAIKGDMNSKVSFSSSVSESKLSIVFRETSLLPQHRLKAGLQLRYNLPFAVQKFSNVVSLHKLLSIIFLAC